MNTNLPMTGTINRLLINAGITPTKEAMFAQMRQVFTLEESLRMAYVPILLTKTAFRFAEEVCRQCVAQHLPHKKETRIIRQAERDYIHSTLGTTISRSTLEILEQKTDLLFTKAGNDVQTLWFVVNQELKKQHPTLDEEYPFLTDLFCAVSLLHYVRSYESACDIMVKQRTGLQRTTFTVQEPIDIYNALLSIAGRYTICHTSMIHLSVRIISMKVDEIVQQLIGIYRNEMKGLNK